MTNPVNLTILAPHANPVNHANLYILKKSVKSKECHDCNQHGLVENLLVPF